MRKVKVPRQEGRRYLEEACDGLTQHNDRAAVAHAIIMDLRWWSTTPVAAASLKTKQQWPARAPP
jgi:hypothetical protein